MNKIPLKQYFKLFSKYLKNHKKLFILLIIFLFTGIFLQIVNPQIMRYFIDTATGVNGGNNSNEISNTLLYAAISFISIAILTQIVNVAATYLGENISWKATNELRSDLTKHCLNLDMEFHNNRTPGEMIERVDGDVEMISTFFSQFIIKVVGNLILLLAVLTYFFYENFWIGLIYTTFAIFSLFVLDKLKAIAIPAHLALREANAELFGFLEERLTSTEDIRSTGSVNHVLNGLYKVQRGILKHWINLSKSRILIRFFGGFIVAVGTVISILSGYVLVYKGIISIGVAYVFIHYTNILARPLRELTQQIETFQSIGASLKRVNEMLQFKSNIIHTATEKLFEGKDITLRKPLKLEIIDLKFSYPSNKDKLILDNIDLTLEPGKILGLIGRTGSGKTTIGRLIFRLYNQDSGEIKINGKKIGNLDLEELRNNIAIVSQDVQIFRATVRENLTFFDNTITDDKILSVMNSLNLNTWFDNLENGLDTNLATGGTGLSAGEAQLLALTRIFLKDPKLIILDEASSKVDPVTEKLIENTIDKLLKNRTVIIIAHRLSTIKRADDVLILEDGKMAEYGKRKELESDKNSKLFGLLQTIDNGYYE